MYFNFTISKVVSIDLHRANRSATIGGAFPRGSPMSDSTPIVSPCRKQCQLHPIEKLCFGCFRTIDEISSWARFSDARRRRIMETLPARRAAHEEKEAALKARRGW